MEIHDIWQFSGWAPNEPRYKRRARIKVRSSVSPLVKEYNLSWIISYKTHTLDRRQIHIGSHQRRLSPEMEEDFPGSDPFGGLGKSGSSKKPKSVPIRNRSSDVPIQNIPRRHSIASPTSRPSRFESLSNFILIPDDLEDSQQEYNTIFRKNPCPGDVFHVWEQNTNEQDTAAESAHEIALQLGGRVVIVIRNCSRSYMCLTLCAHYDNEPNAEHHWRVCAARDQIHHDHEDFQHLLINTLPMRARLRPDITINIETSINLGPDVLVLRVGKAEMSSFIHLQHAFLALLAAEMTPNLEFRLRQEERVDEKAVSEDGSEVALFQSQRRIQGGPSPVKKITETRISPVEDTTTSTDRRRFSKSHQHSTRKH